MNTKTESMILGTKWLKKWFEPGSRMTKTELNELVLAGEIPGWVKGGNRDGTPYVNEFAWKQSLISSSPTPEEHAISGLHLLQ